MRSWSAVSSKYIAIVAVVSAGILGACSENTPSVAGPEVRFGSGTFANSGLVKACVSSTSPSGTYNFSTTGSSINQTGTASSVLTASGGIVHTTGTKTCFTVFDRLAPSSAGSDPQAQIALSITEAALTSYLSTTCTMDSGTSAPADCNGPDVSVFANYFHGTEVVFAFEAVVLPDACDRMTYGGFVLGPPNISYGGNVGYKNGVVVGNLNFKNHTNGDHIQIKSPLTYSLAAAGSILSQYAETRVITGNATINGAGSFAVEFRMTDLGEPGTSDRIYLSVGGNVLIPAQIVGGGNLQLHKC